MPNVIARFQPAKAVTYCVGALSLSIAILVQPIVSKLPFDEFLSSGRYATFWPIAAIASFYIAIRTLRICVGLIIFRGVAIYENNGLIIYIFPLFWNIDTINIASIKSTKAPKFWGSWDRIVIQLKNGKKYSLGTALLVESGDIVLEKLNKYFDEGAAVVLGQSSGSPRVT
jgi:hypothetical protein